MKQKNSRMGKPKHDYTFSFVFNSFLSCQICFWVIIFSKRWPNKCGGHLPSTTFPVVAKLILKSANEKVAHQLVV
jgi:hypothetical protein